MTLWIFLITVMFFVFLTGLCVGSFLNVVISRAFSNESIVLPRSKCPTCQKPLKWYHNIPLLSYLILKGKCAFCNEKISIQYPIIEFVTGILFLAVFYKFGLTLNGIFMLFVVSLFVVLSATDIKEKVVFDFHTYTLVIVGLVYNLFNVGHLYMGDKLITLGKFSFAVNNSLIAALIGIVVGIIVMEIFARFGYLVAGTRAFGEGDTYIAAGLGAVLGWKYLLVALVYAFIIQVVLTLPVYIKKLFVNKDYKTVGAFFVFTVVIMLMKFLENNNLINNLFGFALFTLVLAASGYYLCRRILTGLKSQEEMTFLPFGPALVIGALIVLFLTVHFSMV